MIFQGLFNILDLYFKDEEIFYNNIENFFREKIISSFGDSPINENNINQIFEDLISFLKDLFVEIGFERNEIEIEFLDPYLEIREEERGSITSIIDLYNRKIAPLVYEIFLEKLVDYLVDVKVAPLMLNLKSKGFLSLEFIIELRELKTLLDKNPEKKINLKKYIEIHEKIVTKFIQNKNKIEILEDLTETTDKLQLLYLIYRVINFFHLESRFDFSHIKSYLADNIDE